MSNKTKVAILGGGVGSIAAAFELTATPQLRERFEVTVYQLGWRIGGKGASGRNPAAGWRIEEHGLHVWFGFYDNAFRLMREAYQELGRPAEAPLATLEDAFKPCDEIVLYDRQGEGWHGFAFDAPRNLQRPGVPERLPNFWEIASNACQWAIDRWRTVRAGHPDLPIGEAPAHFTPPWFAALAADLAFDALAIELAGAEHLLHLAGRLASERARGTDPAHAVHVAHRRFLVTLLAGFRDWLWVHVVAERCERDPDLRLFFTIFDVIATTAGGLVDDEVIERGFDSINDEEWCEWLARHGAHEVTLGRTPAERSPLLRSVYDVAFGYVGGDIANANVAAGTAINDLLRLLFSYRGSLMYKMQAGMGDTVFTPFYEVLRAREVRFSFFTAVTDLGLSADGRQVEEIEVVPQVDLAVDEYDPLVPVRELCCWPSEPRWEQLADGERLRERGIDFEGEVNPLGKAAHRLRRGADFDQVVLGISIGALRPICGELCERSQRFREMVDSAATVRTQAFQLWLREPSAALGWAYEDNSVAGCYVEPLDTYSEMSHLLPREDWADSDGVRAIGYFCGVLDEREGETAAEATARAKANAIEFLGRDVGTLWPAGLQGPPPSPLRWELLADAADRAGQERFDAQYWRANTSGSELYVLTPAGSVKHRLRADESGFENLVLAGDWTKNGIDGGCVEAAATSGIQAARALTGTDREVVGEDDAWLQPPQGAMARYVEYGGRATSPGPFRCEGGRLRGWLLRGDEQRIADLVRRTLTDPAGGALSYRALGSHAVLMAGSFDSISSTTPPFDQWGSVRETQASVWIPVLAGRHVGPLFIAERLCLACPYVFVDNPMSYLGGREDYGYAKTMARFEPESGLDDRVRIDVYGGDFGRGQRAGWHPVLEIAASGPEAEETEAARSGPAELVHHLTAGRLPERADGPITLPGIELGVQLYADALAGRGRQIFVKQFRDAADGTLACYQSLVEVPVRMTRVEVRPSRRHWDVTVHPLDSHPIAEELGVRSQAAELAFDLELDFVLENGVELAHRAEAAGAAARDGHPLEALVGASLEGLIGLAGSVTRRLYRELQTLPRLPWR